MFTKKNSEPNKRINLSYNFITYEKVKIVEAEVNEYPPEEQLKERHNQATEELRKLKTQLNRAKHELSSKQNQLKDKQDMKQLKTSIAYLNISSLISPVNVMFSVIIRS